MGLTSHDVQDTAQSLQLVEAADILLEDVDRLMLVLKRRAVEHKNTPIMGRTHGVHAEPTTFGLKLALWWDEMRRQRIVWRRRERLWRWARSRAWWAPMPPSRPR